MVGDGAAQLLGQESLFDSLPILASTDRRNGNIASLLDEWTPGALIASAGDGYTLERAAVAHVRERGGRTAQFIDA